MVLHVVSGSTKFFLTTSLSTLVEDVGLLDTACLNCIEVAFVIELLQRDPFVTFDNTARATVGRCLNMYVSFFQECGYPRGSLIYSLTARLASPIKCWISCIDVSTSLLGAVDYGQSRRILL